MGMKATEMVIQTLPSTINKGLQLGKSLNEMVFFPATFDDTRGYMLLAYSILQLSNAWEHCEKKTSVQGLRLHISCGSGMAVMLLSVVKKKTWKTRRVTGICCDLSCFVQSQAKIKDVHHLQMLGSCQVNVPSVATNTTHKGFPDISWWIPKHLAGNTHHHSTGLLGIMQLPPVGHLALQTKKNPHEYPMNVP